jgi:Zn ribbon nucleic-acid-binding protein
MYEKEICPNCNILNLIYLGDYNDCTCPNVEAAECYKCGHVFMMGDESNQRDTLTEIVFNCYHNGSDELVEDLLKDKEALVKFLREYAFTQKGEECKKVTRPPNKQIAEKAELKARWESSKQMDKELLVLRRLLEEGSWITTKKLDSILLEIWGNEYDRAMHCNSMMRRGLIDYHCDGDWSIDFTEEDLIEWEKREKNE